MEIGAILYNAAALREARFLGLNMFIENLVSVILKIDSLSSRFSQTFQLRALHFTDDRAVSRYVSLFLLHPALLSDIETTLRGRG